MILEVFAGLHYIEEEITCNLVYCYVKISLASYRCLLVPMCLRTAMAMSPLVMTVPMKERDTATSFMPDADELSGTHDMDLDASAMDQDGER